MYDGNQQSVWSEQVQTHIQQGQACDGRGDPTAAEKHFRAALEALVNGYQHAIVGFCRNMLRDDPELDNDVAQEVFLAAWQALPRFRYQASIRTWIFAIARHKCWDAVKRRQSIVKVGWTEDDEHDIPDNAWSPDQQYEQQNFLARVKASLSQLRSEDREILVLTYITEMPRAEIARLLGIAAAILILTIALDLRLPIGANVA